MNAFSIVGLLVLTLTRVGAAGLNASPAAPLSHERAAVRRASVIAVKVTTDKTTYSVGGYIHVAIRATNVTKRPVDLEFASGQRFEALIRVGGADGPVWWRWSQAKVFTDEVSTVRLAPGKSLNFTCVFPPNNEAAVKVRMMRPGVYVVTAALTTTGIQPSASKTIRVK